MIWLSIFRYQCVNLPVSISPKDAFSLPAADLERLVVRTYKFDRSWLLPRQRPPHKLLPKSGEVILSIELFNEKWLLSVYCEGLVYVWNVDGDDGKGGQGVKIYSLDLGSKGWTSCVSCLDLDASHIVLAVTKAGG
jgi:hypothetical protein